MAEIRTKLIVELPVAQLYNGTELFPIQQDGVARKTGIEDIIDYTKLQDYATWVYAATSNLYTKSLTSGYITMLVDPANDKVRPEFFIGESAFTENSILSGLSGFKFFYDEIKDNFVFTRSISSISAVKVLTAYYIDQNAYTYINNLSTSNTLSARNIYATNNVTISANSGTEPALYIIQNGSNYAIKISDATNDTTPFIIDGSGNVSIKTEKSTTDLTISGNASASGTLSASKIFVWDNVGVGTNFPNKELTVKGSISASNVIYDKDGDSMEWNSVYSYTNSTSALEASVRTFVNKNSANILEVNSKVNTTSAKWDSVYSNWNFVSARHLSAVTYVNTTSASIDNAIIQIATLPNYATNTYVNTTFVKKSGSGDAITGNLNVSGTVTVGSNLILLGSLTAFGAVVQVNPTLIQQSANSLTIDTSATIGKKLIVNGEAYLNSLYVTTNAIVTGSIKSNESVTAPVIYGGSGNSNNWNSTYTEWTSEKAKLLASTTFTGNNSTKNLSVYSTVNSSSADWESVYSNWNDLSAFDLRARTFVGDNSANILQGTSTWNNVSAFYLNARTFTGNNSTNQLSVYSQVYANSAAWENIDIVYPEWISNRNILQAAATFTGNNSAKQLSVYSNVNSNSAGWEQADKYSSIYSKNSGTYLTNLSADVRYLTKDNLPPLAYLPLSGGIMTGALTVNNPIYINYAGRSGNSTDWDNASDYFSLCAQRLSEGVTFIFVNSGNLIPTRVRELSSNWNSVFSTVCAISGMVRGTVNLVTGQINVNVNQYRVGALDVYLNGVKLVNGVDFTATTGNTIVLTEAAKNNSYVLDYTGYSTYNVANVVLKTGDTMSGTLTVPQLIVSNQQVAANITGNTSGVHVGDVNGFGNNFVKSGSLLSTNLTVTGAAIFSSPVNTSTNTLTIKNDGVGNSIFVGDAGGIDATPFVVDLNGNVGIGTPSPGSKLDVVHAPLGTVLGNEAVLARFINSNSNGNFLKIFQFRNAAGTTWDTATTRIQNITDASLQSYIDFNPLGNPWGIALGTNTKEVLTITNANKVGIDTKTPTEQLHVDGNVRVTSGSLSVSGNISGQKFYGDGSGLVNLNGRTAFLKFPDQLNKCGGGTQRSVSTFISQYNTLYQCGLNHDASFGLGSDMSHIKNGFTEIPIPLLTGETVSQFYGGYGTSYILTNFGNLYSIGRNDRGQLGVGNTTNSSYWQKVNISNVTDFSISYCDTQAGDAHCLAVSNGIPYGWGYNDYGQLGLNNTSNVYYVPTRLDNVVGSSLQSKTVTRVYAFKDRYSTWSWSFIIDSNKEVHATGYNGNYNLGFPDATQRQIFARVANVILADEIYSYGYNTNITSFIKHNSTLYSCGNGSYGQHANGTVSDKTTGFTKVSAIVDGTLKDFIVTGHRGGSCLALLNDGTVRTWGYNNQGQLGNGTVTASSSIITPVGKSYTYSNVTLNNIIKILTVGNYDWVTFYLLRDDGHIFACGYNGHGQLGMGETVQTNYFRQMTKSNLIKFIDIGSVTGASNETGLLAADQYGDIWACGYNGQYALGVGSGETSHRRVLTKCIII